MKSLIVLLVFFTLSFAQASAERKIFNSLDRILEFGFTSNSTYQIGEEWGKVAVSDSDLSSNIHYRRMALSTAQMSNGATGFYLGQFNGKHLIATNHHVCPNFYSCSGPIHFPFLKIYTNAAEFYGSWPEIDLALFAIDLKDINVDALKAVASPFAFNKDIYHGEPLVTIGFGIAENPNYILMGNRDSDCKVFSSDAEYRLMGDPDSLNPGSYEAWSFSNGCDVSHGDSGSAMMDRNTGEVIGIIWTGRIPKDPNIQNKAYLDNLFATPSNNEIWEQLSYGVPAVKMKSFLQKKLNDQSIPAAYVATIEALLK